MKVKLLVGRSGADGAFAPGDEILVSDAEGLRMIAAGQCVAADAEAVALVEAEAKVAAEAGAAEAKAKASAKKPETADKVQPAKAETTAKK